MTNRRRTVTGLAVGAAGMLYSRFGGKRSRQERQAPPQPEPAAPEPEADPPPQDASASPEELDRARTELSEELARRAATSGD